VLPEQWQAHEYRDRSRTLEWAGEMGAGSLLQQEDSDRVGLFSGRASRDPYPERSVRLVFLEELRHNAGFKKFEHLGITKECCDRDEQVANERLRFISTCAQKIDGKRTNRRFA
jgi:hypothetical protein